ncbi:LCP family protein [Prauserella muralis]|uniref:LytTR family transcriptional regulator n=1 Tax=Prauserella muralis TaxID=588067 RepID=A0A2V4AGW4_9PSEU|nr:LCP family protein [Prauserella muralis]PXY19099.1 LytTR family transcriptional regulator [Prauserella muralis]TWE29002.1 LytR family transcriptional attenuator [Prauserella muralis]
MTYGGHGGQYGGQQPPPGRRPPRGPRQHQSAQMLPVPGSERARQGPPRRPPQQTRVAPPPHQPPPGRGEPPMPPARPRKRRRWTFGRVVMALFMVFVLVLASVWLYLEFSINRIDALPEYEGQPAAAEGTNWLIVGSDSRQGLDAEDRARLATGDSGGQRTDTIMIAHLPDNDTAPTLLSLPRDSVVEIPGHGTSKINAAFAIGGAPLLARTIEQATGLHIDHYAEIGFGGFANMVDAMGGVEMDIPAEMKDPKTGITIPAGKQTLDGAQALGFVRMRYSSATPRSDLDRVANQRKFIGAMASQMASPATLLNPFDVFPLLADAPDALTMDTDDHLHNLVGLAWAMRGISDGGVVTTTVPVTSSSAEYWDEAKSQQLFDALRNDTPLPDSVIYN